METTQKQIVLGLLAHVDSYPLIMLGMMGIVIVVLLVKVLPVFQQVFQQMGMEMNTLSLGLLKAGSILSNYSGIFLILVVLLVGLILFLSLSEKGHIYLRNATYHLPVFRDIPLALRLRRVLHRDFLSG